jgi:TorA maturation chaperone TorD
MMKDHVLAEKRSKMYGFLASICLQPPSESLAAMIRDGSILKMFDANQEEFWLSRLKGYVDRAAEDPELIEDLTAEHASFFVLPSGVIPHEAVYKDKKKRLGGRDTMDVARFYQLAGAEITEECIEMPDHLGIELQFMEFLCGIEKELAAKDEADGLRECHRLQNEFLNQHLLQWAFQCCEDIFRESEKGFYGAVANLVSDFLSSEKQYMAKLTAEYAEGRKQQ